MSVKKIFMVLIIIVVCVAVGAIVINVLMPNVVSTGVNAVEQQIYNATSLKFDFNGDGNSPDNGGGKDFTTDKGTDKQVGAGTNTNMANGDSGVKGID